MFMTLQDRRARAIRWLDVIRNDMKHLFIDNQMFWELQEIIADNPELQQCNGLFQVWLTDAFVRSMTVRIRRQVKLKGKDSSVSLRRLLEEVRSVPTLVSRKHYLSFFADAEDWNRQSNGVEYFDSIAGAGAEHLPVSVVESQIAELETRLLGIEDYVDKRIAHHDEGGMTRPMPTFAELNDALAVLEKQTCFYLKLLADHPREDLRWPLAPEWKDALRLPWIQLRTRL